MKNMVEQVCLTLGSSSVVFALLAADSSSSSPNVVVVCLFVCLSVIKLKNAC